METTLRDRICVVTGATSGMGQATATTLAHLGATVVLVARNPVKGETVRDLIRQQTGNSRVEVLLADLASLQETRALAQAIRQQYAQVHVLINNAGGIHFKRETTTEGMEKTLAVNFLTPFLLTQELLDLMKGSAPARIINISSSVERLGRINWKDIQRSRGYISFPAYSQAKLLLLLATYELARRLDGTGVTANAVVPGPVATNFGKDNRVLSWLFSHARSPEAGAHTTIALASAAEYAGVSGKAWYNDKAVRTSRASYDVALQRRAWELGERLTQPMPTAAALSA